MAKWDAISMGALFFLQGKYLPIFFALLGVLILTGCASSEKTHRENRGATTLPLL